MKITYREIPFINQWINDLNKQVNAIDRGFYIIESEQEWKQILKARISFLQDILSSELVSR